MTSRRPEDTTLSESTLSDPTLSDPTPSGTTPSDPATGARPDGADPGEEGAGTGEYLALRHDRPPLRVRTVVLGLVLVAVAVGAVVVRLADLSVDGGLVVAVGLLAAGAALLVGALLGGRPD